MQKKTKAGKALMRKYPEQVVLVTTRDVDGHANVMAVGWAAIASSDPVMFSLGINSGAYTCGTIRRTREFVVAFPNEDMARETLYAGTHTGKGIDKFGECALKTRKATRVRAPLIADAVANFECELVRIVMPGDCPTVFGKVVAAHVNADPKVKRLYTVAPGHRLAGVRARRKGEK